MTLAQQIAEALAAAKCTDYAPELVCEVVDVERAVPIIDRVLRESAASLIADINDQGYVLVTETSGGVTPEEAATVLFDAMNYTGEPDER